MRSHRAAISLLALLLACAACSGGPDGPRRGKDGGVTFQGIDGRVTVIRPGDDSNKAYSEGLDLKTQGNCPAAVLKLRPVANFGPGYENAQTALGACLLQTGAGGADLSAEYLEGLTWLRRAADAGWPKAQGSLATAHAFGPSTIRNGEEAAYWLALYLANPNKSRIGFIAMPAADIAAVDKSLSPADKSAGQKRAATWQRKVWMPPALPADDMKRERGPRQRERRMQAPAG